MKTHLTTFAKSSPEPMGQLQPNEESLSKGDSIKSKEGSSLVTEYMQVNLTLLTPKLLPVGTCVKGSGI